MKKTADNVLQFRSTKQQKQTAQKVHLTDKRCESFQQNSDNWGKYLRDDDVGKLCFILSANGKGRYAVKQRQKGRKGERKITIGYLGDDIKSVRQKAREVSSQLSLGIDPDNPSSSTGGLWTVRTAFLKYMNDREHKQTTVDTYNYNFNRLTDWHHRDLSEITTREWRDLYVSKKSEIGVVEANRMITIWKAIYNYLVDIDELEVNPVRIPKQVKANVKPRESRLPLEDIRKFIELLTTFKNHHNNYLLMMFLLAPRKNELRWLKWSDVDLKQWTVTFRNTKNHKDYVMPFGGLVRSILEDQKAMNKKIDGGKSEYVFRSPFRDKSNPMIHPVKEVNKLKIFKGFKGVHDFRRTIADIVHDMEIPDASRVIGLLLKHSSKDVTGIHYDNSPVSDLKIRRKAVMEIEHHVCRKYCFELQDVFHPDCYLHERYPHLKDEMKRFHYDVLGKDEEGF